MTKTKEYEKIVRVFGTFVIMAFIAGGAVLSAQAAGKSPYDRLILFGKGKNESCYFDAEDERRR